MTDSIQQTPAEYEGGIAMLTPETVHYGREEQVLRARQSVLDLVHPAHSERFVRGIPTAETPLQAVYEP